MSTLMVLGKWALKAGLALIFVTIVFVVIIENSSEDEQNIVKETELLELPSKQLQVELQNINNQWLELAKNKQWEKMLPLVQKTYKNNKTNQQVADDIKLEYENYNIDSYQLQSLETVKNDVFYKLTSKIVASGGVYIMNANIIKEVAPYKASIYGTWGINPISAMFRFKAINDN